MARLLPFLCLLIACGKRTFYQPLISFEPLRDKTPPLFALDWQGEMLVIHGYLPNKTHQMTLEQDIPWETLQFQGKIWQNPSDTWQSPKPLSPGYYRWDLKEKKGMKPKKLRMLLGRKEILLDPSQRDEATTKQMKDYVRMGVLSQKNRCWRAFAFQKKVIHHFNLPEKGAWVFRGGIYSLDKQVVKLRIGNVYKVYRLSAKTLRWVAIPLTIQTSTLAFSMEGKKLFFLCKPTLSRVRTHPETWIFLITLDTTRYDLMRQAMPYVRSLADNGVEYTHTFSPSPWTLPSHASFLTGMDPHAHGLGVWRETLPWSIQTLQRHYHQKGYLTGAWVGGALMKHQFGLAKDFDLYVEPYHFEVPGKALTKEILKTLKKEKPTHLFGLINYFDPHAPYKPHRRAIKKRWKKVFPKDSPWYALAIGMPEMWEKLLTGNIPPSREGYKMLKAYYEEELRSMDHAIQTLITTIQKKYPQVTLRLVFVGDHGEYLGEKGYVHHSTTLYQPVLHVPFFIWEKGLTPKKIASWINAKSCFTYLLEGRLPETGQPFLSEEHEYLPVHPLIRAYQQGQHLAAIFDNPWKAFFVDGIFQGVYNLRDDPKEEKLLSMDVDARSTWQRMVPKITPPLTSPPLDDETVKNLKALGYLQ